MEQYAAHTADALKRVNLKFPRLRLDNRLALIVPDAAFRKDFEPPLLRELSAAFDDVDYKLIDAENASACVLSAVAEPGQETLVLDTVEQFDGLERLIVIAIGLDAPIVEGSDTTLETRSRLYRALTRAHMMALVVNEKLRRGWLEFLGHVKFDGLDASAYDADAQESKQTNAAAVVTAKTLSIREEVQKAAEQRQLRLEPVVREAIVRQVKKVAPGDATAASKITTYLDICKEKLPLIEEQLQRYCSEARPQKLVPAVMVAVLDGEEVEAAVQKEVEKEAAAAVTPEPRQPDAIVATTAGGKAAQGARIAAPQEKKLQAVWDTSDIDGFSEPAAYNPYAKDSEGLLHDVPMLPAHYMPRPEQWDLRDALVNGVRGDGMVVCIVGTNPVTGIAGTAGLGKTTTANWLALDPCVRSAFCDGIFWLEFGKERTAIQRLVRLAQLLGVPPEDLDQLERRGVDSVRDEVARRLKERSSLIILDDVWEEEQLKPFQKLAGGRVTVLMTTRKSSIVDAFGEQLARLELRPMEDEAATCLMVQSSGKAVDELHEPSLAKLVKMCAGVPAMLRSVGRMCNTRSAEGVVKWFADHQLRHQMPTSMARADGYQQDAAEGNLFLAYEAQLDGLAERDEELATRCTMCAIFREGMEVPLEVLSYLWGTDEAETREVVERLGGEHLVELVADGARIQLLDPLRDYLRSRGKSQLEGW